MIFIFSGLILINLSSCKGGEGESDDKDSTEVEEPEAEGLKPGMTPFDFPTVGIEANEGDYVLTPSYKMWTDKIASEDPTAETYIFYTAKMAKPGDVESEIEFTFDGNQKMPNSMVIPLASGQTASKGDILLTWWQTGSGMQRAIVTDDSNPAEPVVRYLDLDFDNPATDSESGKSIGQTDYPLEANSFVKITNEWQPGNMIAGKDETWGYVTAQIIRVAGDKVLTIGFAGKMKVYNKADCVPMPIVPEVNPGDKVQVVGTSSFVEGEVVRVDKNIGRVFVKTTSEEESPVPYGEITTTLEL
jgi:hypothetical protein